MRALFILAPFVLTAGQLTDQENEIVRAKLADSFLTVIAGDQVIELSPQSAFAKADCVLAQMNEDQKRAAIVAETLDDLRATGLPMRDPSEFTVCWRQALLDALDNV